MRFPTMHHFFIGASDGECTVAPDPDNERKVRRGRPGGYPSRRGLGDACVFHNTTDGTVTVTFYDNAACSGYATAADELYPKDPKGGPPSLSIVAHGCGVFLVTATRYDEGQQGLWGRTLMDGVECGKLRPGPVMDIDDP